MNQQIITSSLIHSAVGAFYLPEHHANEYGTATLNLIDDEPGTLRALLARLTGIIVIANPKPQN